MRLRRVGEGMRSTNTHTGRPGTILISARQFWITRFIFRGASDWMIHTSVVDSASHSPLVLYPPKGPPQRTGTHAAFLAQRRLITPVLSSVYRRRPHTSSFSTLPSLDRLHPLRSPGYPLTMRFSDGRGLRCHGEL